MCFREDHSDVAKIIEHGRPGRRYGRLRAKSGAAGGRRGATPAARRATILAFLAALESDELDEFLRLMFRGLGRGVEALADAETATAAINAAAPARVAGVLKLLTAVVAKLGFKVERHAASFASVCVAAAARAGNEADDSDDAADDSDDDDEEDGAEATPARLKRERAAALACLKDVAERYAASPALAAIPGGLETRLWDPLSHHLSARARVEAKLHCAPRPGHGRSSSRPRRRRDPATARPSGRVPHRHSRAAASATARPRS